MDRKMQDSKGEELSPEAEREMAFLANLEDELVSGAAKWLRYIRERREELRKS